MAIANVTNFSNVTEGNSNGYMNSTGQSATKSGGVGFRAGDIGSVVVLGCLVFGLGLL